MNRFIAIDVRQGDAFYLNREDLSVLIDGGRSRIQFPAQFENIVNVKKVDIVVCTHNDSDHANGILGFMDSHLKCKEVWLPGSWTTRLNDLLMNPSRFVKELATEIENRRFDDNVTTIEDLANSLSKEELNNLRNKRTDMEEQVTELDCLYDSIEDINEINLFRMAPNYLYTYFFPYFFDEQKFELFMDALNHADRIREIAILAYIKGATIRWFEFSSSQSSGGIQNKLEPVNSKEIFTIPRYKPTVLDYLTLSAANKESLVFFSPSKDNMPGVLFSADSDFSFNQSIPWCNEMIITTPHHGSEANKNVYDRFKNETNYSIDVKWIRSDCKSKKRPGRSLLNVHGFKYCTLCRGSELLTEKLEFKADSNDIWKENGAKKCVCR